MTAQLIEELTGDDERPWAEWRDGKPMSAHGLGRMLRAYRIKPDQMKLAGVKVRGYRREDFEAAWDRYLPPAGTDVSERYSG